MGHEVKVVRNNISLSDFKEIINTFKPKLLILSPGPGTPEDSGITIEVIKKYYDKLPIFGVCLGHQSLAHAFGGKVERLDEIIHGKQSYVTHNNESIFKGLPNPVLVGRYHSLGITKLPSEFDILAKKDDIIMAIKHRTYPIWGVQFHPESILSPSGILIIRNILKEITENESERDDNMTEILSNLIKNETVNTDSLRRAMNCIMDGKATTAQIGAFLMGISSVSLTSDILATCASVMKEKVYKVSVDRSPLVDTCGTGGDGTNTFNISTVVAFIVAACGINVAKHGNKSMSSKSGSADVLSHLGINLSLPPEKVAECLNQVGISFLFAPLFHSSMKHVAQARRELGVRTIFNLLGPLANPLSLDYQIIGIYDDSIAEIYRDALIKLGVKACTVVCGNPLDEVSTISNSKLYIYKNNKKEAIEINPEDYNISIASLEDIKGGMPEENAQIMLNILDRKATKAQENIVVLNAAVLLWIMDKVESIKSGITKAKEVIQNGEARKKLDDMINFSKLNS